MCIQPISMNTNTNAYNMKKVCEKELQKSVRSQKTTCCVLKPNVGGGLVF